MINRRTALLSTGAALTLPVPAFATTGGRRAFRIWRGGSDIGSHLVTVTREGDAVRARTEIDIAVKFLGITAYRYRLSYDEIYRQGVLQSLSGAADDDGKPKAVQATRIGDMLSIEGTNYTGPAPGTVVPTSYWRKAALGVSPWISAEAGELLPVAVAQTAAKGPMPAGSSAWQASDSNGYDVEIWYDAAGDWTGCAFDARGELAHYALMPGSDPLTPFMT